MSTADGAPGWCERHEGGVLALGVVAALALRCAVSVFPHSGEGTPPMYGDFEAQRHWMEITTALPVSEWYENSTNNDLQYWGLDYPPLTAYHSYAVGSVGRHIVPECFALLTSRGHESSACRAFMRLSVVLSDAAVYLPGAYVAVLGFAARDEHAVGRLAAILALWMLPPLVLIDHGHFQYNGVCFGLCLAAAGCVAQGRKLAASVLFTGGLLFKQIALYYAPAFFFGILALCARLSGGAADGARQVVVTGMVVIATAAALFAPWLAAPEPQTAVAQILHRMFPFARGLYEDKVHEKSVLFPCVAACLIPVALGPSGRPSGAVAATVHVVLASMFSMYPLVVKDMLHVPYVAFCAALIIACELAPAGPILRAAHRSCYAAAFVAHAVHAALPPPPRYPDLWTLLITGSSCAYFVVCLAGLSVAQVLGWLPLAGAARADKKAD